MSGHAISERPVRVPRVHTRYRRIVTSIPNLGTLRVLRRLSRCEARAMHGQLPVLWDRAEGAQVTDGFGNRWLDFTSTIFVANTGHANPALVRALQRQLRQKLVHTYTFASGIRAAFLERLIAFCPAPLEKAFLLSSGTEATECAVKLMRLHGQQTSRHKVGIVSFTGAMHGRTMAAELLKGMPDTSPWVVNRDPQFHHLPFPFPWNEHGGDWGAQFRRDMQALQRRGVRVEKLCGFMIESYLGWGAIMYPKAYIRALVRFARQHNLLVCFDEIQSGYGRTGKLFAYEHYGVRPDLVCTGKAMSGGLPLSAVIGRRRILDLPGVGSMSSTHSANPLCCAAGLATIDEMERKHLVRESARRGKILHAGLQRLQRQYPERICCVLGTGMVAALIICDPRSGRPDGEFASRVCELAMRKGLLMVHTGRESIKIGPPLTIPDAALREGIAVIGECFAELTAARPRRTR